MAWVWPLPVKIHVPAAGESGCFWEDRRDCRNCGVDLYIKDGTEVYAVESGKVLSLTTFSSPNLAPYWNMTQSILVEGDSGLCRYSGLHSASVNLGVKVEAGRLLGYVGVVVCREKVGHNSPQYIRDMLHYGRVSMLHFELWSRGPVPVSSPASPYKGGDWFHKKKPDNLLDPTTLLQEAAAQI